MTGVCGSMTTYFVSGHLDITIDEAHEHYRPRITQAIAEGATFVVGDAKGADWLAQAFLKGRGAKATVFHMFKKPRHNEGFPTKGGFESDLARDIAMTEASDADIAWVRPGREGGGTALNLARRSGVEAPILCPYCGGGAESVGGDTIYPHRPDLFKKKFWSCGPCGAYVGCHKGTDRPLGRLANAELRSSKMAAHRAFDPLWRDGPMKRKAAYAWLTRALGIDGADCHIGMMDVAMCKRVVEVCEARHEDCGIGLD